MSAAVLVVLAAVFCADTFAGQEGHYTGGIIRPRDVAVPEPGLYYTQYNPVYTSNQFRDRNGVKVTGMAMQRDIVKTIDIYGYHVDFIADVNASADVKIEVDSFGMMPTFIWVTKQKLFGAKYGMFIQPYFGYEKIKVEADLDASVDPMLEVRGYGIRLPGQEAKRSVSKSSSRFDIGDMYVQPIWLGWSGNHYDLAFDYGFFAPTGGYNKNNLVNIGKGFWSHIMQVGGLYYPNPNKSTALMGQWTYELNGCMHGQDIRPGDNIIFEYGLSQYLTTWLEIGFMGFDIWEVTQDHGMQATGKNAKDQDHAIGAMISVWPIQNKLNVSFRATKEVYTKDRFKGDWYTATVTYVF
jgi:hypothetical protein